MKEKYCSGCDKTLSIDSFGAHKGKPRSRCKPCHARDNRNRYHTNPNTKLCNRLAGRRNSLKYRYGINEEAMENLLKQANYKCEICSVDLLYVSDNTAKSAHVDHDHNSGEYRGILCRSCNTGLGFFKDNVEFLKVAVRYMERKITKN